jgi:DNA-binding LacI/PurR family transcriptional regulator
LTVIGLRVTLESIAAKANVSPSTVSRVLNNYTFVEEETRLRVWEVVRELGYPLDRLRRHPAVTQSVLLTGMGVTPFQATPEFFALVRSGVEQVLSAHDFEVRSDSSAIAEIEGNFRRYASRNPGLRGLILLGSNASPDVLHSLKSTKLPFVVAGGQDRSIEINCVMADYLNGMEQAVNHLLLRGRRKICLINGPESTATSQEKYKGFRLALILKDLPFSPQCVIDSNYTAESGYESTRKLLEDIPELDAIVCADDYIAVGALRALQESNRHVPEDVAVVGFHDYSVATYTHPPLTTVSVNMRGMGIVAAQRLLELTQLADSDESWFMLMPTQLIIRNTS